MIIYLKKFGTTLNGRSMGREAWLAFLPTLNEVAEDEKVEINFDDVVTFTPSWGDEFLSPLLDRFGDDLILKNTENPSILVSVKMLEKIHQKKFKWNK